MSHAAVSAIGLAGVFLGYALRWLHERSQQQQRERVLYALSGALPDWEQQARDQLRAQADIARREWGR